MRRGSSVPEGRHPVAWGVSPRCRGIENNEAPEGRHVERARTTHVAPPGLCDSPRTWTWGLRPRLIDAATPWLVALLVMIIFIGKAHAEIRTWNDTTGKFSIKAELIDHNDQQVTLKKPNGQQITVPLAKLSAADRRFLSDLAEEQPAPPITLGPSQTYRVRIGMQFTGVGNATGIVGIVPVPIDWAEQSVRVIDQEKTANVGRISFRDLNDGARQMQISVPRLRRGEEASATITYEVTRHGLVGPEETAGFRIPKRLNREMRHYLLSGPLTNAKDNNIIAAKDNAIADVDGAWNQVRAIHDWVVDNVEYQERPEIKSASASLLEKVGDCQELSSLFVAMCRAHGVPARCVWIPNHSYVEFYLEDAAGRGHWFPAESTNKEQFGYLPRTGMILQKGDNLRVPEFREPLHYARTIFKAADIQGGQPEFQEIREIKPIP